MCLCVCVGGGGGAYASYTGSQPSSSASKVVKHIFVWSCVGLGHPWVVKRHHSNT